MSYTVYQIICSANGKVYVGYTSRGADVRFKEHLDNARWKRKTALYSAIRRYGNAAFNVTVLQECGTHAEACEIERLQIAKLNCVSPHGYNMTLGGDGVPLSAEQREQGNAKKRGRCSQKQKDAGLRRRGAVVSNEARAKMSEAGKGRQQSSEHVQKRVEAFRRNRAAKLGIDYVEKPTKRHTPRNYNRGAGAIVWTTEKRIEERARALAQWTPEAKEAARKRGIKQWTPEARQAARERVTSSRIGACLERKRA